MADDRDHRQDEEDIKDTFQSLIIIGVCVCLLVGASIGFLLSQLLATYLYP